MLGQWANLQAPAGPYHCILCDLLCLQPVRSVSLRAAAEEVEIAANNGAAPSSVPANMLDFEELSDIVRSAKRRN
jgi:hypothetical protein